METQATGQMKYCDDLFHKGQTGGGGCWGVGGGRWISGRHTQTRPLIWLRGRWTLLVDVHIIFLAGQSSPILAVHNGAAGDTRCFSLPHSERQGHPDRLNWMERSLFGQRSAGSPWRGLAVCKLLPREMRREATVVGGLQPRYVHPMSYDI